MPLRIGRGLRRRHAIPQTAEGVEVVRCPAGVLGVELRRDPQVGLLRELEPRGHHADHGVHAIFDAQVERAEVGGRPECLLPVATADDGHRRRPNPGIARRQAAPARRQDAEDGEEVLRHHRDVRARRLGRARYRRHATRVLRHGAERPVAVPEIRKVRVGEPRVGAAGVDFPDGHQTVRLGVG